MDAERQFVSFLLHWHGLSRPRRSGLEGLRRTIRQLQGADLPVSDLESPILRMRVTDYSPLHLDELIRTGEVVWQGNQALGQHDGQISLFMKQDFPLLGCISMFAVGTREQHLRDTLVKEGLEFEQIVERLGGFPEEMLRTLWKLAWNGEVGSDSLDALRARLSATVSRYPRRARSSRVRYGGRKRILPGAVGRWTLLSGPASGFAPEPERAVARARQWLDRLGIASRRTLAGEDEGFEHLLPGLEHLESRGMAHRGRFFASDEPEQFAAPGAADVWRVAAEQKPAGVLSACDPANPFGAVLPWPRMKRGYRPQRAPGSRVLIHDGRLVGYLSRTGRRINTPENMTVAAPLIDLLKRAARVSPVYLESVDGDAPYETPWHDELIEAGFSPSRRGYLLRSSA
jgi:ATP-dependent Lhr-like helicase